MHLESCIRLVTAILGDCVVVAHPRKWCRNLLSLVLSPELGHQRLVDLIDILFIHKRHLDVNLGELLLTVCPQVFISETLDDLEIAVHPRHHQNLLVGLGALRKRKEAARIDPARDQIVPGTLRCTPHQYRCLYLCEFALAVKVANGLADPGAEQQILLKRSPAEIQIAVTQSHIFIGVQIVTNLEGRSFSFRVDPQLPGPDLNFSGLEPGIHCILVTLFHLALNPDHKFRSQRFGSVMEILVLLVDHNLGYPVSISEVDKDDTTQVSSDIYPAIKNNSFTLMLKIQLSTRMRSFPAHPLVGLRLIGFKFYIRFQLPYS